MKQRSLERHVQPGEKQRHEWEAFLGLIPAIAGSPTTGDLINHCRRIVRHCQAGLIRREDFGLAESAADLDQALARLVREGTLAPIAGQPYCFRATAVSLATQWLELESAVGRDDPEDARRRVEDVAGDTQHQMRLQFEEVLPGHGLQEDEHAES